MGVEEELEGFTAEDIQTAQRHLAPLWTSHQDGSLRNGGVEFVTNGGLGGADLYSAFERLTHLLANVVEYQDTFRCSTHMHVDMLDFTVPQVVNFLLVYTACEPYLFEHCGQYRRSSNFCVPVGDSLPFHKTLISTLYEDCVATRYSGRYTNKYTALNLQPLFGSDRVRPIGTVEFRGGRPMTTMDEFLLQANLLLSIKQFVRTGPADPEELLRSMGDTVTNSVYANGAAQHLRPDVAELEDAMISSWMLLKSFQQGMKKKQVKGKAAPQFFSGDFATLERVIGEAQEGVPTPNIPTVELRDGYWNDASVGIPMGIILNGVEAPQEVRETHDNNPYPRMWSAYSLFFDELQQLQPHHRRFTSVLCAILKGRDLGRLAMGEQEAMALGIIWQLNGLERNILPAVRRAMTSRVNNGRRQCLLRLPFSQQPTITIGMTSSISGFDWCHGLREEYKRRFGDLFGRRAVGPDRIPNMLEAFFHITECKVRVKNRGDLLAALNAATIEDNLVVIEEEMFASDLFHLMRMAGVPSENHVFRGDLSKYDRIAEAMAILYASGLSVPVRCSPRNSWWGEPAAGNGRLRVTRHIDDRLGLGYRNLAEDEEPEWVEARTPRVTLHLGQINIY